MNRLSCVFDRVRDGKDNGAYILSGRKKSPENFIRRILVLTIIICLIVLARPFAAHTAAGQPLRKAGAVALERTQALRKREAAVRAQEEALKIKKKQLAAMKADIDKRITRLARMQKNFEARLAAGMAEYQAVKNKNFKKLIKIYSAMSPSKLAPLLNAMSDLETTRVLRAMKTDLAAKVIAKLEQAKAVAVSKQLGMLGSK